MLRIHYVLLKLLCTAFLVVYFLAAGVFLGIRYWILPNIDQWRPYIAQQLSTALHTRVSLGEVKADWHGLHPRLELTDVSFTDRRDRKVLSLPKVRAVLSWRSVLVGMPQFVSLQADNIDISIRRDRRQRLWVLGQSFQIDAAEQQDSAIQEQALAWLMAQRQLRLRNTTIRWVDEFRLAPPMVLKAVTLTMNNVGVEHRFSLVATPAPELGQALDMRGRFEQVSGIGQQAFSLENSVGQIYVHVEKMRPVGWRPWLDMPQHLESGEVSAQSWLAFADGKLSYFTSDTTVKQGRWRFGDNAHVQADFLRLYMAGTHEGMQQLFPGNATANGMQPSVAPAPPVEFRLQAKKLDLQDSDVFEYPLNFQQIDAQGTVGNLPGSVLQVQAERVNLLNRDMQASLEGRWQQGGSGPAGIIDIHGRFKRAEIAAINEYLPNTVNLEAREWMSKGLVGGQIHDAELTLNGDLEHFPFSDDPFLGNFKVTGKYTGGIIDYLPPQGKALGWPRLTDMQGTVELQRADLRLQADTALMQPAAGLAIELNKVAARIPNIEENSILSIDGATKGKGESYLALMTHSPLGEMLDGVFNEASADDVWEVPLSLTIPLLHSHNTTVNGAIHFSGSSVRLMPEMPPFTQVKGSLDFTDTGISTKGLKASFLGGPLTLGGGAGKGLKGLQMQGQLSAQALADYVGLEGMKRLQGVVPYKAVLQRNKEQLFSISLDSNLTGLALDLPAPLGKPASQAMPLHAKWQRHGDGKNMALAVSLGKTVKATMLHNGSQEKGAYFYAAAVGVDQSPDMLAEGVNLDIRYPTVNIDDWNRVVTEFSTPADKSSTKRERVLLPGLKELRLQAAQAQVLGVNLDELTFTARQPQAEHWRVDVSSSQTAGTLFWREAKGRVAGRVDANFDRLALGSSKGDGQETDNQATDDSFQIDDDLDIPGVNLRVKNFSLYGHDAGELSVIGVNQERGRLWRLDELKLASPWASLAGAGLWRLRGQDRGLTLDAEAQIKDLGAYFEQIGMKDVMKGGKGTLKGQFQWRNMPWTVSKSDLNGKVVFDLEKGRFSNLNSYSARLLELLSLQSIQRLARLDFNPSGLSKEGFPYDKLRGTLEVKGGLMHTNDYRVVGPVGTIVIGGDVNLINKNLNLQAVVIPNLDVSGAAIAAGIAINPIVGLGAFLTQWLLQGPLAKAMTVEYQISGAWDDPKIKEIATTTVSKKSSQVGQFSP
ncbi:TIGR02099 family protein [Alcaligenaceae bacterium]|nr:TIGR02099 family protein [Alcaligenaceae bacterium]